MSFLGGGLGGRSCRDCAIVKPLAEFTVNPRRSDGRGSYCRECFNLRSKASYRSRASRDGRVVKERTVVQRGSKLCPDCGEVKDLDGFPRNKSDVTGRHSYCKPCHNVRTKETRDRLYGGSRHYHLKRRYGIGADEVAAMIEEQGGVCAICGEAEPAHVDHDHATGRVRGVLCFNCNGGLGQFRDRIDVLEHAIAYLRRTSQWQSVQERSGVYQRSTPAPAPPPSWSS